ncbi:MAG: hypothetical protein ABWX68_04835 [Arthrobacter sp.]|uniref:hypothetical protein n=1 Tax=Arthrobacter sp. TaxID=1667 RepID=UPI00347ED588
MGLRPGRPARDDGVYPGQTPEPYSDAAGRSFSRHWANLMNEPAWHETTGK